MKKKKCSKLCKHASLRAQINSSRAKAWVFTDGFCSQFIGRGFTRGSNVWIKLGSDTVHYLFCFAKSRKLLLIRDLYSIPNWQGNDFINTRTSKACILNFSVGTFWPQNYSFDSILVQAGHLVFLQGNQRKNNRTNCLNNFSFTTAKNVSSTQTAR